MIRRGSAKKRHEQRRLWLMAHPDRYEGVPGIRDDVTDGNRLKLVLLCAEMRKLDLFGHSPVEVQRETVRRLVSELRGEHVSGGEW